MNKEFSFDTMEEFDKHISSSIPAFNHLQDFIVSISRYFIKDNSTVVDLGCSTGLLLRRLSKEVNSKAQMLGIDISSSILDKNNLPENILLISGDITSIYSPNGNRFEEEPDLAFLIFTLQFIDPSSRLSLLKNLRSSMKPRAGLIIAEKIYTPTGREEEIISMAHYDYKRGFFSGDEILEKQLTLRRIMTPLTEEENVKLFNSSGFYNITPIWQSLNFKAWLIQK